VAFIEVSMTKERIKDLLIIGMLPFLVVAWETTDWNSLRPLSHIERDCPIFHQNANIDKKCEAW